MLLLIISVIRALRDLSASQKLTWRPICAAPTYNETGQNKTFAAIQHARSRIQSLLAGKVQSKFCPVLHFYRDEKFKKTLETMRLIDQAAKELEKKDSDEDNQSE